MASHIYVRIFTKQVVFIILVQDITTTSLRKLSFILYFIGFFSTVAASQKLPFKNFNSTNGIINNRTHIIQQDGAGYIWAGTDMGIIRYDGVKFKHYPAPGKPAASARDCIRYKQWVIFCIDSYGMAICYKDSVRFLNPKNYAFGYTEGLLPLNDSTFLLNDLNKGFVKIKGDSAYPYPMQFSASSDNPRFFSSCYQDVSSNIWFAGSDRVTVYKNGDLNSRPLELVKGFYINGIRPLRNGDIVITAVRIPEMKRGLFIVKKEQLEKIGNAVPKMIWTSDTHSVQNISEDEEGNIWLCSDNSGIFKFSKEGRLLRQFTTRDGLISNGVWDVFFDRERNLWAATENGISLLPGRAFKSYDFSDTRRPNMFGGVVWSDSLFLTFNDLNIFCIADGSVKQMPAFESPPVYINNGMFKASNNELWIQRCASLTLNGYMGMGDGKINVDAYNYTGASVEKVGPLSAVPDAPAYLIMNTAYTDAQKNSWCCSNRGLELIKGNKFYPHLLLTPQGDTARPMAITRAGDGKFWALLENKGIARYASVADPTDNSTTWKPEVFVPHHVHLGKGVFPGILVDRRNNVWFTYTDIGVNRLVASDNYKRVEQYLYPQYFSSFRITELLHNDDSSIWVGTANGLDKITLGPNNQFSVQKDLFSEELCGKLIYFIRKNKGTLFVGTTGSVAEIDLNALSRWSTPPPVYVTSVNINGSREIKDLEGNGERLFDPEENSLRFDFIGISYKSGNKIKYKYTLKGLDKDWSAVTDARSVTYTNIPSGAYTFEVSALSIDNIWSAQPALFHFTIRTPFYRTAGFDVLAILLVAALLYMLYRYRIDHILKVQKVRARIARDLHDDIGATVSSINIVATLAKENLQGSKHDQSVYISRIVEDTKYVQETLGDIVWSINPNNDRFENILARMRRYASELFEARGIDYDFMVSGEEYADEVKISMENRQHLYMIFKEAVNNLAKYSNAENATVDFIISKKEIHFTISDNGIGFDKKNCIQGNGLKNMKERAVLLKGTLTIASRQGHGTKVDFTMPC